MMESLRQLFARFSLFWSNLKLWQRASLVGAVCAVVGFLAWAVLWAGRVSYEPLYVGLEDKDQGAIVDYLRENRIPFQLDSVAKAILLPRDRVYEAKIALAQEGLPKGGSKGLEIFDESKMGMSEFAQRISYVRALEGELERTIAQMDAVERAKVGIVLPSPQLFLQEQKPSTASVMLRLRRGADLLPTQVKAIIHLVSRSVDGLLPDDITVVDTMGRMLSEMLTDDIFIYSPDGRSILSAQRELERQQERELEKKARESLERRFGAGHVKVAVKLDLDMDKKSSSFKEYIPNSETGTGVPRSTNTSEENYTGQNRPPEGNPGTTTNIPGYAVNTQPIESEYNKAETTRNFEITTREGTEALTPGRISRMTASVIIDAELSETELADARDVALNAIGYYEARGDSVVVKAMKFDTSATDAMMAEDRRDRRVRMTIGALIALTVLVCAGLAGLWWMKRRRARQALNAIQKESKHVPTIQEMLTSPDLLAFQGEMAVLEEQLKAYARNNPNEVANLVNEWVSSEA
jgi:flagellar M-ring protein FliF